LISRGFAIIVLGPGVTLKGSRMVLPTFCVVVPSAPIVVYIVFVLVWCYVVFSSVAVLIMTQDPFAVGWVARNALQSD
jgi:hypothetical protein